MSEPVVLCQELTKTYAGPAGSVHALRGVDLRVEPGERLAITGPSGCGKSTLLNVLGALDHPTGGRLEVGGQSIAGFDARRRALFRRTQVGFVFQQFQLIPSLTARENVALPLRYANVTRAERNRRAHELLERVGLADRADHFPTLLSGGEQQRVAISRALITKAPLILADEPTGNLDGETARTIVAFLRDAVEPGTAIVMVTHDPEVAGDMDRQVRLRGGRVEGARLRGERVEGARLRGEQVEGSE
jgi:putative ABC transport system ATP-binding protein